MNELDLSWLSQTDFRLYNDAPAMIDGELYADRLVVEYAFRDENLKVGDGQMVFAGNSISIDLGSRELTGGVITAIADFRTYTGSNFKLSYSIQEISLSAVSAYKAGGTYFRDDDIALLSAALSGADIFSLSDYDDIAQGYGGDDLIYGRGGHDLLWGGGGSDRLEGGLGNDSLYSGAGSDTLLGGVGNDMMDGGPGSDRLEGSIGNDIYVLADADDTVVENANAGIDQVRAGYSYTLGANLENLLLTGATTNLKGNGNALNNQLIGNGGHNVLFGFGGDDTLQAGAGNDTLYGGNGNDQLEGGIGNDILFGEGGNDLIDGGEGHNNANAGHGDDTVRTGAGSDTINAGANNDSITSGAGGDRIYGLDGNDTIDSGTGHDIIIGGAGNDLLRGCDGNDDLAAEMGSDTLDGGAGNDMLRGGAGADLFMFNDGLDTIRNFDRVEDQIDLRSFSGLNTWVDVQNHLQQEGGHITFRHGDDVLRIDWTQLVSLGSDDFIW